MSKYNNVPISDFCIEIVDCLNRTAPVVEKTTPFKMIRTSNVRNGFVDLSECRYVTKETYEKWTRRRKPAIGDIVLTREAPLGNVGIIREENTFLGQRTVQYVIDEKIADNFFLMYYLMSYQGQAQIKALGSGSTVHHMRVPDSKKIMIPKVPLEIQQKVGFILSQYDELIINNTKKIKILEEIAQRLYEEWFVNFRFPGFEKVKMVDSELGKIPEGWSVRDIGEIFHTVLGGTPSRKNKSYWDDGHIPWINSGKVNELIIIEPSEYITDKGLSKSSAKIVPPRTTVLAITGATLGQVSLLEIECSFNQSVVAIIDRNMKYNLFIYQYVRENIHKIIAKAGGGAQQHINKGIVDETKILIPSDEIIFQYNKSIVPIFDLIKNLTLKNNILSRTRDLLLPRLISGEIEV